MNSLRNVEKTSQPLLSPLLPSRSFSPFCRFVVRDFTYDTELIEKQKSDLISLEAEEKELWTDLLRLSRINFSECFMVLVHLKVVRAFVESVLRYGLPAAYFLTIIKVRPLSLFFPRDDADSTMSVAST